MKAYIAHAMTGRSGAEMWKETLDAKRVLGYYGISTLDPVEAEGVSPDGLALANSATDLRGFWKRDKQLIREAHVLIDLTPGMKSEGVSHELGYARYFLWKPVIRVGAIPSVSVARFEDDIIVPDLNSAGYAIKRLFGTRLKRTLWRIKIYSRYWRRGLWHKMGEWK